MFRDILVEDNCFIYAEVPRSHFGDGIDVLATLCLGGNIGNPGPNANENVVIKYNIFYLSQGPFIASGMPEKLYIFA